MLTDAQAEEIRRGLRGWHARARASEVVRAAPPGPRWACGPGESGATMAWSARGSARF